MTGRPVVFEAWRGRYADNPRSISTLLAELREDLDQVWILSGPAADVPSAVATVDRRSAAHMIALARAGHFVTNDMTFRYPPHRRALTYLQTWHGTPLKKIGFDIYEQGVTTPYSRRLVRDVRRWTHMISPSPEVSAILRSAFGFRGRMLETGYPRNDALAGAAATARRDQVRRDLGIEPGVRAILYAPTWRDYLRDGQGRAGWAPEWDLRPILPGLAEPSVVLLRLHPLVATPAGVMSAPGVVDVSKVADIADLYLAADVLVTDYSSAFFDFAVTGKPILFYAYDIDRYVSARDMYFPLDEVAPGPVLGRAEELTDALNALDEVGVSSRQRYASFVERFLPFEDGSATRRVIGEVFGDA